MKIHEYQGKAILREYGVAIPDGFPAFTIDEAAKVYDKLDSKVAVVKAQIHAGGRGKGGGIKLAHSRDEVKLLASKILGMTLVTHQTGPEGKEVQRLLIEQGVDIDRELYAGIVLDRESKKYAFIVSTKGGMEIEKVAAETPENIIKEWIDPSVGLQKYQLRNLAFGLGLQGNQLKNGIKILNALWNVFVNKDCSLIEINPLVVTTDNAVIALDAKLNFDDNGLFRHKKLVELRDTTEEDPAEIEAGKYNLSYIKLELKELYNHKAHEIYTDLDTQRPIIYKELTEKDRVEESKEFYQQLRALTGKNVSKITVDTFFKRYIPSETVFETEVKEAIKSPHTGIPKIIDKKEALKKKKAKLESVAKITDQLRKEMKLKGVKAPAKIKAKPTSEKLKTYGSSVQEMVAKPDFNTLAIPIKTMASLIREEEVKFKAAK